MNCIFQINKLPHKISIGKTGENVFRSVRVDMSRWLSEYPSATVNIVYERPDGIVYDVQTEMTEGVIEWNPTSTDLSVIGTGRIEIRLVDGDTVGKSATTFVVIEESIEPTGEVPDPYESWYEDVLDASQRAQDAQVAAEAARDEASSMLDSKQDLLTAGEGITIEDNVISVTNDGTLDHDQLINRDAADQHPIKSISGLEVALDSKSNKISISKIKNYLYDISFDNLEYDYAYDYFNNNNPEIPGGACSSVRNGNFYGRNLDWYYNKQAEFIVHTPAKNRRYASIGIAGAIPNMTMDFVDGNEDPTLFDIIPFFTQDGINEYGLIASTNVVPLDNGFNVSVPEGNLVDTVCSVMLVRYILDNFKTAQEACEYISEHVSVWFPQSLHDGGYEQHYMIADNTSTYVLEFVDNAAVYIDISNKPYMTNFYINGVILNGDGKVYTPATLEYGDPVNDNHITPHGSGLERYNQIIDAYSTANTYENMRDVMNGILYTKAYSTSSNVSSPYWFTEFVGGSLNCNSPVEDFSHIVQAAGNLYTERSRNDSPDVGTWQTVHSVVYDMSGRSLFVVVQEDGVTVEARLDGFSDRIAEVERGVSGKQDKLTAGSGIVIEDDVISAPGSEVNDVWLPTVAADGTISWEKSSLSTTPTPRNIKGQTGEKGDKGDAGAQGLKGDPGTDGADGISATHSWNGTVLTITSASGTSSADLKGDKGDTGEQGPAGPQGPAGANGADGQNGADGNGISSAILNADYTLTLTFTDGTTYTTPSIRGAQGANGTDGTNGQDGYTPVKGTDYWTAADQASIVQDVLDALPTWTGGSY